MRTGKPTCASLPVGVPSWCSRTRRYADGFYHLGRISPYSVRDLLHARPRCADALLTDTQARSLIELSQAASFQRAWSSLYEALEDGQIDRPALIRLFAEHVPAAMVGERLVLGVDVSSILRPDVHTSADHTLVHRSNLPKDATPVGPSWQFSTVVVLPDPVSSATSILVNRRVPSTETATTIGVAQLTDVLPLLRHVGVLILIVRDRGYGNAP
ncbi:MAG: transposase [Chloroflexales bacterium]